MANETITSVKGFKAAAMHCGIKQSGKPDLALLASEVPATAAAVFTQNKVVGAPVIVGRQHIQGGILRACITNSGCANVCTGQRGVKDALAMCDVTAHGLGGVPATQVLPFSTGVIGHFLPMDKIRAGIPRLIGTLSDSQEAGLAFAQGILTTDLVAKAARETVMLGGRRVTIAGNCKGSGMIAPNMAPPPHFPPHSAAHASPRAPLQATMLAYVATDAAIDRRALAKLVAGVTDVTFNCVTVDQHTSTSDTFVVMANGLAENRRIRGGAELAKFAAALRAVCDSLARQIARDGEGATKLVTVRVIGAKSPTDARRAAEAIANSPLCKTAIHGGDPNWGRFVSAAGYSGAAMKVETAACAVGKIAVFKNGQPTAVDLGRVETVMKQKTLEITVDLGFAKNAKNTWRVYTCDLSREYITINADYHT